LREIWSKIEKYGLPGRDLYELPTSEKRFPDNHFLQKLEKDEITISESF